MSFEVTYKEIATPDFNNAMRRVWQEKKYPDAMQTYRIKRLVDKLMQAQKGFHEKRVDLEKRYRGQENDPEKVAEFQKEMVALGESTTTIDWHRLSLSDIEGLKLSAGELTSLEPLLEEGALDKEFERQEEMKRQAAEADKQPAKKQLIIPGKPQLARNANV